MPVYTPTRLAQAQAATTDTTLYTVPGAKSCIIKELVICNTTSGSVAIWVSFCSGSVSLPLLLNPVIAVVGDVNRVISNEVIPAYSTVIFTFSQVINAAGFVSAKAGAALSLTVTVSGVEVT